MAKLDIALGIIAGAAIGDALGAPLEFLPPRSKRDFVTEMKGGGVLRWKPGDITDDTIMSMAITDMYLTKNGYDQQYIVGRWEDWKRTGPKDIGNWTHRVLGKWSQQRDRSRVLRGQENPAVNLWLQRGQQDAGNGAVMRCMPTAVARHDDEGLLVQETVWLAEDTHPDPRCVTSCLVVNKLLRLGFHNVPKKEAYARVLEEIREIGDLNILGAFESAPTLPWEQWDNNGYSIDTVKCAIAAWLQFDSFEDGLIHVVNRGNDADTVGAVAGALLGAYHGFQSIPQRWWNTLDSKVREKIAKDTAGLLEL